jgi:hypothetical protein
LELYRRIRLLRVSAASGPNVSDTVGTASGTSSSGSSSRRKPNIRDKDPDYDLLTLESGMTGPGGVQTSAAAAGDSIDSKYHRLYEEKMDPFKLEEYDRVSVLSRFNFIERSMAYGMKQFFQDRWARHAIMIYLLLVHICAFAYVINVLNPQLIDEVDSHLKEQYNKETLELAMESEHPDVRVRW